MSDRPASPTLAPFVAALRVGEPLRHGPLTLVPVCGEGPGRLDYTLAADALAAGQLTVTEVHEAGDVQELLVTTQADTMVLFLDGEELIGAKQNRILNTSVLLPARAKVRIPVSCVEQGRWRYASPHFRSGGQAPADLRARKAPSVTRSLREGIGARSDQSAVWEHVAERMADLGVSSPTGALHHARLARGPSIDGYLAALPCPAGARGVVAAIDGQFTVLDLFDRPETLAHAWPRLVASYALDALAAPPGAEGGFSQGAVQVLLEQLALLACTPCPSRGVGEDWRFEGGGLVGQALVVEGNCVHLCAFPRLDRRGRRQPRGRIHPPSQRRRRGPDRDWRPDDRRE